jgi:hypothetical protein
LTIKEIFEKCSILFKIKEDEDFNRSGGIWLRPDETGFAFHWASIPQGRQKYKRYFED